MGTQFFITLFATNQAAAEEAADAAFQRVNQLEEILSDYQADSELNLLREKPVGQPIPVSHDLGRVLKKSQEISSRTDGAFDATIGPCVRLWRFSRKRKILPTEQEHRTAMAATGWRKLQVHRDGRSVALRVPNMRLDVGGIAKGFAADEALQILREHGITRAFVAASGDISIGDPPPGKPGWRVEVTGLGSTNSAPQSYVLSRCGISTSGDVEQSIEINGVRYSHILDPRTGLGLTNRVQVTAIAPNATLSDPLATTGCVLGAERANKLFKAWRGVEARFVTPEDSKLRVISTPGFPEPLSGN